MTASSLIFVEIADDPIVPARTWTDPATGVNKPFPARQVAYVFNGGRYPVATIEVEFPDTGPYRPGRYLLAGDAVRVSTRKETKGELQFNKYGVQLIAVEEAVKAVSGPSAKLAAAS